ncbi:cyclic nucleotide-binding domain-containing protein [Siculibacillus lacustris]|uniref:Cyclic nucleotide-binding domain-containing protein n=1 Tax=Siculibacillus lacustris TaxID=1549641 RepID=A0A4Q9VND4_9HYPH|nr:helix-turn-helix domain-containing protein [Siculibacillus lacustris]TBW37168.1 cyclic nucleotide-binding domain-containing protein [Siculibacillus lacustris]
MAYTDRGWGNAGALAKGAPLEADDGWQDFARSQRVKTQRLAGHDAIFYEGDPAERVYELLEGAVMLFKLLPDGRRQLVEIVGPDSLFGVVAGKAFDCNAETLTPCVVRILDRRELENSAEFQGHVSRCLRRQIERLHDHAVLLGRKSAFERVATFLMRFVPDRGVADCAGPRGDKDEQVVELTMTRQEIADFLGLTIETVSRVISDLKRRGLIAIEKQDRIRITDVCGVCHLTGTR